MKNYGYLGGFYSPRPTTSTDNTLFDFHYSLLDTQPHSLIVNYVNVKRHRQLAVTELK